LRWYDYDGGELLTLFLIESIDTTSEGCGSEKSLIEFIDPSHSPRLFLSPYIC